MRPRAAASPVQTVPEPGWEQHPGAETAGTQLKGQVCLFCAHSLCPSSQRVPETGQEQQQHLLGSDLFTCQSLVTMS